MTGNVERLGMRPVGGNRRRNGNDTKLVRFLALTMLVEHA